MEEGCCMMAEGEVGSGMMGLGVSGRRLVVEDLRQGLWLEGALCKRAWVAPRRM